VPNLQVSRFQKHLDLDAEKQPRQVLRLPYGGCGHFRCGLQGQRHGRQHQCSRYREPHKQMNTSGFTHEVLREVARNTKRSIEEIELFAALGNSEVIKKCKDVKRNLIEIREKRKNDKMSSAR